MYKKFELFVPLYFLSFACFYILQYIIICFTGEFEWICGHCHDEDRNFSEYGKTWGNYNDARHRYCKDCKKRCGEDENCGGVQCYEKVKSSKSARSPHRCEWRKERISEGCITTDTDYLSCWKQYTRMLNILLKCLLRHLTI